MPKITVVKEVGPWKKVETLLVSDQQLEIYRELQYLGDFTSVEDLELRLRSSCTHIRKSLGCLERKGLITLMNFESTGEGEMAIANS